MSWIREGTCNQCGECCKAGAIAQFMLNLTRKACKYLIKSGDIYNCEITAGKFANPEVLAIKELIPKEDFDYWLVECKPYPDPSKEEHTLPVHTLPSKCSYTLSKGGS